MIRQVTMASSETTLRQALTEAYETYQKEFISFVKGEIAFLQTTTTITAEEFASHIFGVADQKFVDTDAIYESGAIGYGLLVNWQDPTYAPHEVARNHILIALYKVLVACVEKDAIKESSRLMTLCEIMSDISVNVD